MRKDKQKIALTGSTGHIGANLVPQLLKSDYSVRLLINSNSLFPTSDSIELIKGNLTDRDSVDKLINGADMVIHLAAKVSIEKDMDGSIWETNATGTENIVKACLKFNIKRLIHFSTIDVFDPLPSNEILNEKRKNIEDGTAYDKSKIEAEKIVMNAVEDGLDALIINPTSVYGPNDFKPSLLGGAIIDLYNGKIPALLKGGYDFVFVDDIINVTIKALEHGKTGERYIMSGKYYSLLHLAGFISELGGKKKNWLVLPNWLVFLSLPYYRFLSIISGKPAVITKTSVKLLQNCNQKISSDLASRDLHYEKTPIKEGLIKTLSWYKSEGMIK